MPFKRATWNRVILLACVIAWCLVTHDGSAHPRAARGRALPSSTPAVTIVLPLKLMAAHPATLAVFGFDGKLAPAIAVALSDGESVTTDRTGRAHFTAPATSRFLLAHAAGVAVATLIDRATGSSEPHDVSLAPVVSLHEHLWICAPGLEGDSRADHASINGHPALVLAASPECLTILPPPAAAPGRASVSITAPGVHWEASTTLVALSFEPPRPALQPGQKGLLRVRVRGSTAQLRLAVENTSPNVLRFVRGGVERIATSGGADNSAAIPVEAIRSGNFSFRARILRPPDPAIARRYLLAAAPYASRREQGQLEKLARRLAEHPRNDSSERRDVARLLDQTVPGVLRILLSAAASAL